MQLNRPDTLNLVLGYRCNVQCRHCCTSCASTPSEPAARKFLDGITVTTGSYFDAFPQLTEKTVVEAVDHAGDSPLFHRVAFTGGEPILFKPVLLAGLRRAKAHGLATRMVSTAPGPRRPKRRRASSASWRRRGSGS